MPKVHVDHCTIDNLAGWIDLPTEAISLFINQRWFASVRPVAYRQDLERGGIGDGRRGFTISLSGLMSSGNNHIELRDHDDVLFEGDLSYYLPDDPDAHELSRRRWRGDEPDHALTFGAILSGDTLWDAYQTAHRFTSDDTILEIGPGYGRLLKTALDRRVPFRSYMGIDLSEARISRLAAKFTEPRCGFAQGDAESWRGSERFSVVICSSTFEHFHPDCRAVLHNIRQQLREGATVLLDFPGKDHPFSGVDGSGAYVRCYPKAELRDVFAECGYSVSEITECSIGNDHLGRPVDRFVVIATPRHALPRTVAKTS